jgi:hypothetical protein
MIIIQNVTIAILDFIYRPVFYLNHNVSEPGICFRLQVEPTQMGPIDRVSTCLPKTEIGSTRPS